MKKILITGCSRGLGLTLAESFLGEGNEVFGCARNQTDGVRELIKKYGDRFHFFEVDLSQDGFLDVMHTHVPILDGLDCCVFNAAAGVDGLLASMSESDMRQAIELNLISPMLLAREVVKGMLIQGGGNLIFISSIAAKIGFKGLSVYSATKSAITGFSKTLAREYGAKGIRSNVVLPGFLETEMSGGLQNKQIESIKRRIPVGLLGQTSDVVGVVEFLMSEDANYVNGTEIVVDGGMSS